MRHKFWEDPIRATVTHACRDCPKKQATYVGVDHPNGWIRIDANTVLCPRCAIRRRQLRGA